MDRKENMENVEVMQETENNVVELEKKRDKTTSYNHVFKKPFKWEGIEYKEIEFDFGGLTGNDALSIETEMEQNNEYPLAPEVSKSYQLRMAARAGNVPSDLIAALPFQDFNRITNAARNFLVGQDL